MNFLIFMHFALLPFGSLDLGSSYLGLTFVTSILIIVSVNFRIFRIFRLKDIRRPFLSLAYFFIFLVIMSMIYYRSDTVTSSSFLRQNFLFIFSFFAISQFLIVYPEFFKRSFVYLNFGTVLLILFVFVDIGVTEVGKEGRISTFGMNPNLTSLFIVFAFFFNLNKIFKKNTYLKKALFTLFCAFNVFVLVRLGSLSALGVLFFGLVFYFYFEEGRTSRKILFALLGLLFSLPLSYYTINSEVYSHRLQDTENIENISGRKNMWELGLDLFSANKFFGIGAYESSYQRYRSFGTEISFHNFYIETLVNTGLFGMFFFLIFMYYVIKRAYRLSKFHSNQLFLIYSIIPFISIFSGRLSFVFFVFMLVVVWPFNQKYSL